MGARNRLVGWVNSDFVDSLADVVYPTAQELASPPSHTDLQWMHPVRAACHLLLSSYEEIQRDERVDPDICRELCNLFPDILPRHERRLSDHVQELALRWIAPLDQLKDMPSLDQYR